MHAFVIGNVALDETYSISTLPEPGVSIFGRQSSRDLGGKGCNQAVMMARCGLATTLVAPVARDDRAGTICAELAGEPLIAHLVETDADASDVSIILTTPDGENSIITTRSAAASLTPHMAVQALAGGTVGDLLVVQGNLNEDTTLAALREARSRGIMTAFNPSPLQDWFPSLWPLVDIVFLNQSEALSLTSLSGIAAGENLLAAGLGKVVLTLGSQGCLLVTSSGTKPVAASPAKPVDTTGAGDSFMGAALASAALRGTVMDERALHHGALVAAITVSRRGTRSAFPSVAEAADILSR